VVRVLGSLEVKLSGVGGACLVLSLTARADSFWGESGVPVSGWGKLFAKGVALSFALSTWPTVTVPRNGG